MGVLTPYTAADGVLRFDMLVTPFKTRNESAHWSARHFQLGSMELVHDPEQPKSLGANIVNVHQGASRMNDYISYPFVPAEVKVLSEYSDRAHELGLRVKVYYTTGLEVSDRASEIAKGR